MDAIRISLKTNRGMLKTVLLGLVTLGVYPIVVYTRVGRDMNTLSYRDGKKTRNYCLMLFVFFPLTLSVAGFVWSHRLCRRMSDELLRRGLAYRFGASDFWLWNILGTAILVGPFIFLHRLFKAMNMLCGDYNARG